MVVHRGVESIAFSFIDIAMLCLIFSKIKRCRPSPRSLYFAAKQGNVLQVLILAAGCNVNATIPQERHKTAMHAAASAGHVKVLGILALVSMKFVIYYIAGDARFSIS